VYPKQERQEEDEKKFPESVRLFSADFNRLSTRYKCRHRLHSAITVYFRLIFKIFSANHVEGALQLIALLKLPNYLYNRKCIVLFYDVKNRRFLTRCQTGKELSGSTSQFAGA
jgi:hypothetical protein